MVHFYGLDYRTHTSCISEAQKYQGALYRPEKEKKGKGQNNQNNKSQSSAPQRPYVEDAAEVSNAATPEQVLPEAPSPPSAVPGFQGNVFEYMVDSETPNASHVQIETDTSRMIEDTPVQDSSEGALVEYSNNQEDTAAFTTPAPKLKKSKELKNEEKKDKKRKRLHVDVQDPASMDLVARDGDEVMADAPPVLHSGLTGGLNRLSTRPSEFPPSPDYSGAEPADGEISPVAPTKKPKRTKKDKAKPVTFTNGLLAMIAPKKPKKKKKDADRPSKRQQTAKSSQRMLEFKADGAEGDNQVVVYKHPAEHLMSFVTKGPDSERGVSMNKALKRYHRERVSMGSELAKGEEEKELWRSLRLKQNDRGEIVVFF